MIIKNNIITDLNILSAKDLYKLKPFMEDSTLKVNKSQIARELKIDRRTVSKYIEGFEKSMLNHILHVLQQRGSIVKDLVCYTGLPAVHTCNHH